MEASPVPTGSPRRLAILFALSGATALAYEVLWARALGQALGHTAVAQGLVLATFLAGLALGGLAFGPAADRSANRVRLYGQLELGVGMWALASPLLLAALQPLMLASPWLAARGAACALVVVPATLLMGGTLPALVRHLGPGEGDGWATIAKLYAVNAAGGCLGALVAGYALIPALGTTFGLVAVGIANLAVGLAALKAPGRAAASPPPKRPAPEPPPIAPRAYAWIHVAAFLAGFTALAYEVAWTRLLTLVLGATTYSFTVMLAGFLAGTAVGGWLVARAWRPGRDPLIGFALAQLALVIAVLVTLPCYELVPFWFLKLSELVPRTSGGFAALEAAKLLICLAVMGPPAVAVGAAWPLAARVAVPAIELLGSSIGRLYFLTTLGNVAGALAASLVLLPSLGVKGLIEAAALGNAVAGVGTLWAIGVGGPFARAMVGLAPIMLIGVVANLSGEWNPVLFAASAAEERLPPGSTYQAFQAAREAIPVLFQHDDAELTATVTRESGDTCLRVNGKVDASAKADLPTQVLLGELPFLAAPRAHSALLIGLGTGTTAGALLAHPLQHLEVAELSPGVAEAAQAFTDVNRKALKDPRLHLVHEDGLAYLGRAGEPLDVIVSQPSNPWLAGEGDLFSRQFYERAAGRLAPAGVLVQWVQAFDMDDEALRRIVRTFMATFPHASAWQGVSHDVILIGSRQPIATGPRDWTAAFDRQGLAAIGITRLSTLLATQMLPEAALQAQIEPGPLEDANWPRLEFQAPLALFLGTNAEWIHNADQRLAMAKGGMPSGPLEAYLTARKQPLQPAEYAEIVDFLRLRAQYPRGATAVAAGWRRAFPADRSAAWSEARLQAEQGDVRGALDQASRIVRQAPRDPDTLLQAVMLEVAAAEHRTGSRKDRNQALQRVHGYLQDLGALRPEARVWACVQLSRMDLTCDRLPEAIDALQQADRLSPVRDEARVAAWWSTAKAAMAAGKPDLAKICVQVVLAADPGHPEARALAPGLGVDVPDLGPSPPPQ